MPRETTRVKVIHRSGKRTTFFAKKTWDDASKKRDKDGYVNDWKEYEGEDVSQTKSGEGKTFERVRSLSGDVDVPKELRVFKGKGNVITFTQDELDQKINEAVEKERDTHISTIESLNKDVESISNEKNELQGIYESKAKEFDSYIIDASDRLKAKDETISKIGLENDFLKQEVEKLKGKNKSKGDKDASSSDNKA